MPADLARARKAGPRRAAFLPTLALELVRPAHHSAATMVHAVTLGMSHLHAHPDDALAREGVTILDAAIAFLGDEPRTGDIAVARR